MHRKIVTFATIGIVAALVIFLLAYSHYFGPVDQRAKLTQFVVQPDETKDQVSDELKKQGFIRSRTAFNIAYHYENNGSGILPGGYNLSASMDVWSITSALSQPPPSVFFMFPPGWRKEQIADKLASTLGWSPAEKSEWLNVDTDTSPSYIEGVYYPDTYLIPSSETPAQVAQTFRNRFQQVFAQYAVEAQQQNIPWTEVVTLASLIEREAGSAQDMPLIAGIMWNRLHDHMALQIDATLQYVVGNDSNWWPVPTSADKFISSPFNTYQHTGLPPHAIDEPSMTAIDAVLNPTKTNCLYYLHDANRQIHCSATYTGQIANIKKYLK